MLKFLRTSCAALDLLLFAGACFSVDRGAAGAVAAGSKSADAGFDFVGVFLLLFTGDFISLSAASTRETLPRYTTRARSNDDT
jgi:hypothetical protein